jgi:hypothetical protein
MGYACRMVDLACHMQRLGASERGPPHERRHTRNYAIVTAAYWGFTLSDGALRMLVLLHFYRLGYSPFTLAFLFLLYEAMGVVANLIGGWLATRYGIARMLAVGLATQITGFLLLSALSPAGRWPCRWPGWCCAGHLRRGQGPDQDRQQVGHQAHRRQPRASCSSGWPSSPAARTR